MYNKTKNFIARSECPAGMYFPIAIVILYAAAGGLLWRHTIAAAPTIDPPRPAWRDANGLARAFIPLIVLLHGGQLYRAIYNSGAIDLALGHAFSAVTWMSVLLFWAAALTRPMLSLGVIVLPVGLLGFCVGWWFPGQTFSLAQFPAGVGKHIFIAAPAYGILCVAFAQALILWTQEKQLRKPIPSNFFTALPAMETMEKNLHQLTWLGFILLTLNLFTGMLGARILHGELLLFNHHVVFAVCAWGGVGTLLVGRKFFGWRGAVAAGGTVAAFGLLTLSFFGARFVSEVILGRM